MEAAAGEHLNSQHWRIQRGLFWLAVALGLLHIAALYATNQLLVYFTKPGTMLVILSVAALRSSRAQSRYSVPIVAGLVCSLVGDVFLMLPSDRFVPGLESFFIAHLVYIAAFRSGVAGLGPAWLPLPFLAYGLTAFWILLPGLGEMKLPVIAYLLVILTMAWQAAVRWNAKRDRNCLFALSGALLFVVSDSVLAFDRFHTRFYLAGGLIMSTYFAAQLLIALSVSGQDRSTQAELSTSK
ncbi:MAG TPA: lysoplasmalogenase [Blastocatellia bacterium]|nr:lysoplasmalogenase [Blastocatellia bacterium]